MSPAEFTSAFEPFDELAAEAEPLVRGSEDVVPESVDATRFPPLEHAVMTRRREAGQRRCGGRTMSRTCRDATVSPGFECVRARHVFALYRRRAFAEYSANRTARMVGLVLDRRTFIGAAAAAATALVAACSLARSRSGSSPGSSGPPSNATEPLNSATASAGPPSAAQFVSAGPRDRGQVALTFHVSGDAGLAVTLLDVLHAQGVQITAFMVGNWLDANRDLIPRFVNEGHDIANHTYTHPTFPSLDRAGMTSEVDQCRDAITRLTGNGGRYFRPSGTANGTDVPTVGRARCRGRGRLPDGGGLRRRPGRLPRIPVRPQ